MYVHVHVTTIMSTTVTFTVRTIYWLKLLAGGCQSQSPVSQVKFAIFERFQTEAFLFVDECTAFAFTPIFKQKPNMVTVSIRTVMYLESQCIIFVSCYINTCLLKGFQQLAMQKSAGTFWRLRWCRQNGCRLLIYRQPTSFRHARCFSVEQIKSSEHMRHSQPQRTQCIRHTYSYFVQHILAFYLLTCVRVLCTCIL